MREVTRKGLTERENEIKSRIPWKGGIYLPTDKFPVEERVQGLERVLKIWENDWQKKYRQELQRLRDEYRSRQRCFIIGNGPSVNETNLDLLIDEITFGVNGIFLKFPETRFRPTFYVVEDHLVAEDRCDEINDLTGPVKLFPIYDAYCLHEGPNTVFFNHRPRPSFPHGFDFSTDASKVTYAGCTVTFTCMQLAYYFGFKEICLVGVDHNYEIPQDVKQQNTYGTQILDMSCHDPNHFHPAYFGRGRRWHDPQVQKMEEAYREALKVTRSHGVEIINATIGGKLEVFPRIDYYSLLDSRKRASYPATANHAPDESGRCASEVDLDAVKTATAEYPKILVIDVTLIGGHSATGQLKKTLFTGWPTDRLMQGYSEGRGLFGVYRETGIGPATRVSGNAKEVMAACESFAPDVILYRPVDTDLHIHDLAVKIIDRVNVPLITYIVDDWPERSKHRRPKLYKRLDASLRSLFARSYACLSICDAMSIAFRKRYGVSFTPIANCVDPRDWIALDQEPKQRRSPAEPFVIRYAGGLEGDKELHSVVDVAQVVDSLQGEDINVRLEVHTMPNWESKLRLLVNLRGVSAGASFLPEDEYRKWLVSCDALLLAYNFGEETIRYTRHSMANSLPEAMASGVPIIAYGPPEVATIAYAASAQFALHVRQRDRSGLRSAILELVSHPERGKELGSKARELAFEHHNSGRVRERFHSLVCEAAAQQEKPAIREPLVSAGYRDLVGPFERRLHANFNERRHPRLAKMYRWMRDKGPLAYLKSNYRDDAAGRDAARPH